MKFVSAMNSIKNAVAENVKKLDDCIEKVVVEMYPGVKGVVRKIDELNTDVVELTKRVDRLTKDVDEINTALRKYIDAHKEREERLGKKKRMRLERARMHGMIIEMLEVAKRKRLATAAA